MQEAPCVEAWGAGSIQTAVSVEDSEQRLQGINFTPCNAHRLLCWDVRIALLTTCSTRDPMGVMKQTRTYDIFRARHRRAWREAGWAEIYFCKIRWKGKLMNVQLNCQHNRPIAVLFCVDIHWLIQYWFNYRQLRCVCYIDCPYNLRTGQCPLKQDNATSTFGFMGYCAYSSDGKYLRVCSESVGI